MADGDFVNFRAVYDELTDVLGRALIPAEPASLLDAAVLCTKPSVELHRADRVRARRYRAELARTQASSFTLPAASFP